MKTSSPTAALPGDFEDHRPALTGYCYRMLGSPVDAQDAVQETLLKAWKAQGSFEGRSTLRSWLYRIATNVCLDSLTGKERRTRPVDMGPAVAPVLANLNARPEVTWLEPIPDRLLVDGSDPSDPSATVVARETIRLAFVAALQQLPPRQRAVLLLCEVMRWSSAEVAELLDMSTASVNSALQRSRATVALDAKTPAELTESQSALLDRYVKAFEAYDVDALSTVIREDARQSMPPYDLWLEGRDDVFTWWFGPGIGCKGSRVIPVGNANGSPAFAQYKPDGAGGFEPWAIQVVELSDMGINEITFFLDAARLFPLFDMPLHLDA